MSKRLRVCFVAPSAYPVLAGSRNIRFVGGAEVQQSLIAAELARRGHEVSMVCADYGQRDGDVLNGVRLLNMCAPDAGLPVVRFLHPRLSSLWSAMRRADADIYYQRASGAATAFVAAFVRLHGRKSVFAAAHDLDFDASLPLVRFARDKILFRYGIRKVDAVVVQSGRQLRACRDTVARDATLILSCYGHKGTSGDPDGPIVWVGTVKPIKRPELFLDLAERLPQYRFRLVGGAGAGESYFEALKQRANALGNVEMTGFVPYADVDPCFDDASLHVNTAAGEGFPNTFLQAWARGIPTVSFFDPGAKLNSLDVGVVVPDLEAMTQAVLALKTNPARWAEQGEISAEHYRRNHTVTAVVDDYERVFDQLTPVMREVRA